MTRIFLFNDTAAPKLMGGKLVPPGEGREVDEVCLPPGELPAIDEPAKAQAPDMSVERLRNLMDMLANPLATVLPMLPEHSDDTLAELARLEAEHDTPRKTLLAAIGDLQLKRAQAKAGGEPA
jgi:hypothetical protein